MAATGERRLWRDAAAAHRNYGCGFATTATAQTLSRTMAAQGGMVLKSNEIQDEHDGLEEWASRIAAITVETGLGADGGFTERCIASLLRVVREQLNLEVVFVGEFVDQNRVFRQISAKALKAIVQPGIFTRSRKASASGSSTGGCPAWCAMSGACGSPVACPTTTTGWARTSECPCGLRTAVSTASCADSVSSPAPNSTSAT
jgi:hypothetical protein